MSPTLLLADDSVTIQRVIELTFADEDVNVVAVSDGDEAIALMDRTPPDIVLADVGMPGRNGYQVAEHIRDTPRLAHIPIVLLTGAFEPIDQAKAKAAGCDGVLAKPFEPQHVIGRVRELLSKPKQAVSHDAALPAPLASSAGWAPSLPELPDNSPSNSGDAGDYFERLDQAFAKLSAGPDDTARPNSPPSSGTPALDWFASPPPHPDSEETMPPTPASSFESDTAKLEADSRTTGETTRFFDTARSMFTGAGQGRSTDVTQSGPAPVPPDRWDVPPRAPAPPPDPPYSYAAAPPPPAFDPPTGSGSSRAWPREDYGQSAPPPPPPPPLPTLPPLVDAFAALLAAEQVSPGPIAAPVWPSLPQPASPAAPAITDEAIDQIVQRVVDRLSDRVLREAVEEKVATTAERLVREEIERIKASIK